MRILLQSLKTCVAKPITKCHQYQRNITVVDYPGPAPPAVEVLHDYDKVYKGTLCFDSKMSEDDIRYEMCQTIKRKGDFFWTSQIESILIKIDCKCTRKESRSAGEKLRLKLTEV